MRTIKFQLVFDTAIGKYITKQSYTIEDFLNFRYGLDCLLEKETENFGIHDHDAFFSYEPKLIAKRQFTGLLDKNGVEIYEGDIVDYDLDGFIERHKIIFETKQCAYFLFPFSKKARARNFTYSAKNDCIVVGNIFQHPHLLEVNHD